MILLYRTYAPFVLEIAIGLLIILIAVLVYKMYKAAREEPEIVKEEYRRLENLFDKN